MCDLDPLPFDFDPLSWDLTPLVFDLDPITFDLPGSTWDGWPELGTWPAGDPPAAPGRAVRRCPTCG